jgi:hypothetical protein
MYQGGCQKNKHKWKQLPDDKRHKSEHCLWECGPVHVQSMASQSLDCRGVGENFCSFFL